MIDRQPRSTGSVEKQVDGFDAISRMRCPAQVFQLDIDCHGRTCVDVLDHKLTRPLTMHTAPSRFEENEIVHTSGHENPLPHARLAGHIPDVN